MARRWEAERADLADERIEARARPRRGLVLIACFAMLLSAGGLWFVYRAATRIPPPGEVPLIRADDQPLRKRPSDPGGLSIPGQGTMVLDGGYGEPKVEQLLPPPETPLPRPAPPTPPLAPESAPVAAAPPAPVAEVPPPAPPPAPAPAPAAAPPAPKPVAVPPPAPKPKLKPAPAPAPAVAAAPPPKPEAKGYRLQLGAVRTAKAAKQAWEHLKRENHELLGRLALSTPRVDLGKRGVFYRIQAGPIAREAAAERACKELKRRGVGCFLVKP